MKEPVSSASLLTNCAAPCEQRIGWVYSNLLLAFMDSSSWLLNKQARWHRLAYVLAPADLTNF